MNIMSVVILVQVFFGIVIGLYFWNLLRNQRTNRVAVDRESKKELEQLRKLRAISLTEPLNEKTRPSKFSEIIGQRMGFGLYGPRYAAQIRSMCSFTGPREWVRQRPLDWFWKKRNKTKNLLY